MTLFTHLSLSISLLFKDIASMKYRFKIFVEKRGNLQDNTTFLGGGPKGKSAGAQSCIDGKRYPSSFAF